MPSEENMPSEEITVIDVLLNPINNYAPTQWQTGDIVSSEKLNKIENNVGPFVVKPTSMKIYVGDSGPNGGEIILNASYNDIINASMAGRQVMLMFAGEVTIESDSGSFFEIAYLAGTLQEGNGYVVVFRVLSEQLMSWFNVIANGTELNFIASGSDEPLRLEEGGQQAH